MPLPPTPPPFQSPAGSAQSPLGSVVFVCLLSVLSPFLLPPVPSRCVVQAVPAYSYPLTNQNIFSSVVVPHVRSARPAPLTCAHLPLAPAVNGFYKDAGVDARLGGGEMGRSSTQANFPEMPIAVLG